MSFFTAAANAVSNTTGKRLFIEIIGLGEGKIRLVLTADVGQVPDNATPDEAKVYALMARPLVATGTPSEVEAALDAKVQHLTTLVDEGQETLEVLRQLKEQAKATAFKEQAKAKAEQPQEPCVNPQEEPAEHTSLTSIGEGF